MSGVHDREDGGNRMRIARVFPRKTNASPNDALAFFDNPPMLILPEIDEVHISVAFTYDMPKAEQLAREWEMVGVPVKMGGPAFNEKGGEFVSGRYLKRGYTITSRGCPNRCWFCSVWKRNEGVKELPIVEGNIIQDDNLLACSDQHIRDVFKMLSKQKNVSFTGGIEAKLLKSWHVELFSQLHLNNLFCAYDTPDDLEPLMNAGELLKDANITLANRKARCYALIGYPKDTQENALKRLHQIIDAGFFPFAMLWRDENGNRNHSWMKFQREWAAAPIIATHIKEYLTKLV